MVRSLATTRLYMLREKDVKVLVRASDYVNALTKIKEAVQELAGNKFDTILDKLRPFDLTEVTAEGSAGIILLSLNT